MESADFNSSGSNSLVPKHVGFILDGNRRWMKSKNLLGIEHKIGADKVEKLIDWSYELDIKAITLYVLSTENLVRNCDYLEDLFKLMEERLERLYSDPNLHKRKMRITAIGDTTLLPDKIQKMFVKLDKATTDYDGQYVNFAVAYGGRHEIVHAVKKLCGKIKDGHISIEDIDEKAIESCLYTSNLPNPQPDLIIRTAGEKRLSGFLLWQCAYSELIFLDMLWPEFEKKNLVESIKMYQSRGRRFGK
ncbi:MAG: di-trans,poly-cis-decaprenylcistransferase [Cenarchaeum symbiont of Oopsacas minuta]|nr:di-trans,poly-cis-decaprenylcistransferase [Cenarchaeum symbiont of Oopsacas minuta]